jgi:hypothetical protein
MRCRERCYADGRWALLQHIQHRSRLGLAEALVKEQKAQAISSKRRNDMADVHHETPVVRETHVVDGGGAGSGFGAGMMLGLLAIVAAVIIGVALLWTQPWNDDADSSAPSVPGVEDTVPDVPVPDVPGGGGGGGDEPAQ